MLAACGGAAAPSSATQDTGSAGSGKITLRVWSHQNVAFIKANEEAIAKFMEQNPDIEVVYEQFEYAQILRNLQTSMQAGTEADVIEMFGSWVCSYAAGGRLAKMPSESMSYSQAQNCLAAPLDGYYCDGKLYGLPNEFNLEVGGTLVNPALFEAAGVTYPPAWANWDAIAADGSQMAQWMAKRFCAPASTLSAAMACLSCCSKASWNRAAATSPRMAATSTSTRRRPSTPSRN